MKKKKSKCDFKLGFNFGESYPIYGRILTGLYILYMKHKRGKNNYFIPKRYEHYSNSNIHALSWA